MKIKEVQAGVKISKNYNSYSVNLVADIENDENPEEVGEILIDRALNTVNKKMELDANQDPENEFLEIEIGAAWLDRKVKDRLSIKNSETEKWEYVNINDLEKIKGGYKRKTNEGVFIFKKIPEERRKNNKMPIFRLYKIEGEIKNE